MSSRDKGDFRKAENPSNDPIGRPIIILCFQLFLTAAAIASALFASKQADVARDQLSLAYPPRLRVMNLNLSEEGKNGAPIMLKSGVKLKGRAYVVNTGRENAVIDQPECVTYWRIGPIPMDRKFFDDTTRDNNCMRLVDKNNKLVEKDKDGSFIEMKPGDFYYWNFETIVPNDYNQRMKLYIIGFVRYHDRLTANRFVLFARMYDPSEQHFIAVKNPDYEGQDYGEDR